MKLTKLVLLLSALTLTLSACDDEESSSSSSLDLENYSFSAVQEQSYSYPDASLPQDTHTPFSTEIKSTSYAAVNTEQATYSYQSEYSYEVPPLPSSSSKSEEQVTPESVVYAVTDMPKYRSLKDVRVIKDDAYYASIAISLAIDEIEAMGFEAFEAVAIVPDSSAGDAKRYVPGIAFTEGAILEVLQDENRVLYSCGFMQLIDAQTTYYLDEDTASKGVYVQSNDVDDPRIFVIESNAIIDGFSGIMDGRFFSYKVSSKTPFGIEITVKDATGPLASYADEELDLYDYDQEKYLYRASIFGYGNEVSYSVFGEKAMAAYEKAIAIIEEGIRIQEETGTKIALNSFVVFSQDLYTSQQAESQIERIEGISRDFLEHIELAENQYLVVKPDEGIQIATDTNYVPGRARLLGGLVKTLMNAMIVAGGVTTMILTAGASTPIIASLVVTGITTGYASANVLEGLQDIFFGLKGDDKTESINMAKLGLQVLTGSKEVAEALYHAIGIAAAITTAIFNPVNTTLSSSYSFGSGLAGAAKTILAIGRAEIVMGAKIAISALVTNQVEDVLTSLASKAGLGELEAKTAGTLGAILAGALTYRGLDSLDKRFNLSGYAHVEHVKIKKNEPDPIKVDKKVDNEFGGFPSKIQEKNLYGKNSALRDISNRLSYESGFGQPIKMRTISTSSEFNFPQLFMLHKDDEPSSPIAGYYDPYGKVIYVALDVVENNWVLALRTIAHLTRHAYQFEHAEFDSPVMKALRQQNYLSAEESLVDYLNNPAEIDAEAYADYIIERALSAQKKMQQNPDIGEIIASADFPDPDTFKEVHA